MTPNKIIVFSILVLTMAIFTLGCSGPTTPDEAFSTFQSPDGLFSLNVPLGWVESDTSSTGGALRQYKFTAPDKRGFIHVVVITQQDASISADTAQKFTMTVLNGYMTKADTIKILTDETIANQRKLTWHAEKGGFGGKAILKNLDSTLVLLIVSNIDEAGADYPPLFDRVLSSYKTK